MSDATLSASPDHPRHTSGLRGHAAAERAFLDAWTADRLHHAWLIEGPRGIGKATLAYRIARFVLLGRKAAEGGLFGDALPPASLDVDPDSGVFHRVAAAAHADLLTVERSLTDRGRMRREIVVADARALPGFFAMTAAEGGYRVAIVDSLDEANRESVNSLLKIVEEPPAHALILLLAHRPGAVLPTIRSRCRRLQLRPLADEDALTVLRAHRPQLAEEEAAVLVRLAEGAPGRALRLADLGGAELHQQIGTLLGRLPVLDLPGVHALGDKLGRGADGDGLSVLGELLDWWLTRVIRRAGGGQSGPAGAEEGVVSRLAGRGSLDRWIDLWEKTGRLVERAEALNLERKQVVLTLFGAMARAAG
ncbi:DNA polymerase III subunit delta' [Desertibaculum subflavum]|uniref:DNA polymerase III subunit delta' n=1 Tax=Desertibaculum subflavum TaxID=2268458 RepID=UPI000E670F24